MTSPESRGRRPSPVAGPRPAMARGAALGTTARGAQTVRLRASFGFFPPLTPRSLSPSNQSAGRGAAWRRALWYVTGGRAAGTVPRGGRGSHTRMSRIGAGGEGARGQSRAGLFWETGRRRHRLGGQQSGLATTCFHPSPAAGREVAQLGAVAGVSGEPRGGRLVTVSAKVTGGVVQHGGAHGKH